MEFSDKSDYAPTHRRKRLNGLLLRQSKVCSSRFAQMQVAAKCATRENGELPEQHGGPDAASCELIILVKTLRRPNAPRPEPVAIF